MTEFARYLFDLDRDYRETGEWRWGERIVEVPFTTDAAKGAVELSPGERSRSVGSSPAASSSEEEPIVQQMVETAGQPKRSGRRPSPNLKADPGVAPERQGEGGL
jgi:hypothetical protein